ncbi:hypothetical protein [Mycolicibacterium sphagni]|uniref:Uncharacterized protein n=1 Tax=Mycolicibacterium sphagni TaxID=1786 RepID=A0ABX2JWR4_9MYCO|nr:hypothetical protein [Mycolicibacterium sphagni]NTY62196.1 hypothetical protein [Mycolicibacterium sphagni]
MSASKDLTAAGDALRDAYRADQLADVHRCVQNCRTAVDYAASVILAPDASSQQRAQARRHLDEALSLDPETVWRRERLHARIYGTRRPA